MDQCQTRQVRNQILKSDRLIKINQDPLVNDFIKQAEVEQTEDKQDSMSVSQNIAAKANNNISLNYKKNVINMRN